MFSLVQAQKSPSCLAEQVGRSTAYRLEKRGERQAVAVPLQSTFHLRFPSCAMWSKEGWFLPLNAPKRENQHTKRIPTIAVVSRHFGPVDIYRLWPPDTTPHRSPARCLHLFACSLVPLVIHEEATPTYGFQLAIPILLGPNSLFQRKTIHRPVRRWLCLLQIYKNKYHE